MPPTQYSGGEWWLEVSRIPLKFNEKLPVKISTGTIFIEIMTAE